MGVNTTTVQFDQRSQLGLVLSKDKYDDTATKFIIYGISSRCTIRNPTYN